MFFFNQEASKIILQIIKKESNITNEKISNLRNEKEFTPLLFNSFIASRFNRFVELVKKNKKSDKRQDI